ncbi:hypothetical protein Y032_0135g1887 [Ancylostoma ceylanicum]|uniref:Reverse transcriptase domain-containing protein n=1 Tax=Ancylostoma ceylanicum TaxID=53326 RepID=A0A016T5K8_9BILA|nr:hypothetical protein Y032_0135g1887 [Ancylostoma ceylanicum]
MQLLHSERQLTTLKEATTALSRNAFDSDHETLAHGNPTSLISPILIPRPNPPNSMSPPSATSEPDPESQTVRIVKNFYSSLYLSSSEPPTAPSGEIHLQVHINEDHAALMTFKPRSAPGSDRITLPSLRILSEILASPIAQFFNDIVRRKAIPPGFAFADTILLYKNGDPADVTNCRPISLLSTLYMVLTKIFTRRLRNTIGERSILPPEQAGFRRNFSTIDHIHALNIIAEECNEFNIQLCAASVDFMKAFDSVELPMLWQALESFGVDTNMIKAVQLLYANCSVAIKVGNQLVNFELQRGVRQGDSMLPILFTIVLQYALNSIDWQGEGLRLGNKILSYLAYVDDIVLLAQNGEDLQVITEKLHQATARVGLQINFMKTNWMRLSNEVHIEKQLYSSR